MLSGYGSRLYSTHSGLKSAISERCIRSVKTRLFRYMQSKNTLNWTSVIDKIVHAYNAAPHSAFQKKFSPQEVQSGKIPRQITFPLLYPEDVSRQKPPLYKKGDLVRLSHSTSHPFRRGYTQQNSTEYYRISAVHTKDSPVTYEVVDLSGEPITGLFYSSELIPTTESETYPIEILQRRRKRKGPGYEIFITWPGWHEKFNTWMDEKDVKKL